VSGMGARRMLPALDGLRAVAAGAVLLTHVAFRTGQTQAGAGGAVLGRLDVGVAVFFVLSGFLLYPRTRPVGRYTLRRAARILPAYWVLLAAVTLGGWVGGSAAGSVPAAYWWLGQGYGTEPLGGVLTQTWTLVPEVAFYAVLPGLVWLARRWEWPVLAGCVLVAYGWIAAVHLLDLPDRMLLWLPGHLDWFAVGMAVAALARSGLPGWLTQLAAASGTCWAAAGALLFLLATPVAGPVTLAPVPGGAAVLKEAGYALVAALLLVPAALGPRAPVLGSPPLRLLGRWSYGIFLWHLVVLDAVYRVTGWPDFSGRTVAVAVLTGLGAVALGGLSWLLVERPALRLADRFAAGPAGRLGSGIAGRVAGVAGRVAGGGAGRVGRVERRGPVHQRRGDHAERNGGERLVGRLDPAGARVDGEQHAGDRERAARAGGPPPPR
jgi:peptidoglycan/LPS O-acetylase OafA/YrhL